ncbi:MAG: hypothetical protein U1A27_11860 [Phycisphaerae bacterium]
MRRTIRTLGRNLSVRRELGATALAAMLAIGVTGCGTGVYQDLRHAVGDHDDSHDGYDDGSFDFGFGFGGLFGGLYGPDPYYDPGVAYYDDGYYAGDPYFDPYGDGFGGPDGYFDPGSPDDYYGDYPYDDYPYDDYPGDLPPDDYFE